MSQAIERIERRPAGSHEREAPPLLFVHGAYAGAWYWDVHFLPWFSDRGYHVTAFSFRGHGKSGARHRLDTLSINDYVDDLAAEVARFERPPVVIAHSMGGFVAQRLLQRQTLPGLVLMAAVPPTGLMGPSFALAFRKPALFSAFNGLIGGGEMDLDAMREALFSQPVAAPVLRLCATKVQPESMRALWDMMLSPIWPLPCGRAGHLLVCGGSADQLIPASAVEQTAHAFGVPPLIFPGMGHGLVLESGWEKVAASIEKWLANCGVTSET